MSEINTSRSSKVSLTSLFRGLRAFLIDETSLIENDFSCSTTHNGVKSNYEWSINYVAVVLKAQIQLVCSITIQGRAEGVKIWWPCAPQFLCLCNLKFWKLFFIFHKDVWWFLHSRNYFNTFYYSVVDCFSEVDNCSSSQPTFYYVQRLIVCVIPKSKR